MNWSQAKGSEKGGIQIPDTWLFLHYYEALNVLFRIENGLRVFVYLVLKNAEGEKWQDLEVSSDDASKTTIAALAKRRIAQEEAFGYLGYPINSPLMHLTSGELVRILTSDSYWPYFKNYFRAAKNVITLKLQEIGKIRNSLAHFRPLKVDDVEVVKQNAKQVLSVVEKTLYDAIVCSESVPTNTTEDWYIALSTMQTPNCRISFSQSQNYEWIRLKIKYISPITWRPQPTRKYFRSIKVLSIDTPIILKKYHEIKKRVSFLQELASCTTSADQQTSFYKELAFTFNGEILSKHQENLRNDFDLLLKQITKETELISEDHLARGEIIHLVNVSASLQETNAWSFNLSKAVRYTRVDDPVEYWGTVDSSWTDYISDTESFPWMPVTISQYDVPF